MFCTHPPLSTQKEQKDHVKDPVQLNTPSSSYFANRPGLGAATMIKHFLLRAVPPHLASTLSAAWKACPSCMSQIFLSWALESVYWSDTVLLPRTNAWEGNWELNHWHQFIMHMRKVTKVRSKLAQFQDWLHLLQFSFTLWHIISCLIWFLFSHHAPSMAFPYLYEKRELAVVVIMETFTLMQLHSPHVP